MLLLAIGAGQIYTTYHWHMQQPIYWPEQSWNNSNTYEKAWDSLNNGGSHPLNDLEQIFGWPDRVAAYQYRVRDAVGAMAGNDAGAQVSYSGCLIENVNSLAAHYSLGYSPGWSSNYQQAQGWLTSNGYPRLDVVTFSYHHALCPLIDEAALRKEIQIYQHLYPNTWGTDGSVGFFPPELAFSERMIKVLAEEGIEWVFVPNSHLSRACTNFPLVMGTAGEMCDPPNLADQINPAQSSWYSRYIDRGCTPTNAYPFAYQPHYARYVDPESGGEYRVVVVPVAMAMSWVDGYATHGTEDLDQIAAGNDPDQPMLIVYGHDGDNAWGGGYSYYMESVPNFTGQALAAGYTPTVVQHYLSEHPVDWNDVVHVEDGAWVNADGDFGSPDYINWNWPLVNASGQFDIANGWAEDERNWAVITAAQNRVETAEQINGGVNIASIQDPVTNGASPAELAWHFFLPALTSGYMYYGDALDMEVKPTIACNNAVSHADLIIGDGGADATPPTVWLPQQLPHNPGGTGFGSLWGYQPRYHDRDFWIWTFVYDVSGVESVEFCYRIDDDGQNPMASDVNETYAGGTGVGDFVCLPMAQRSFPTGNVLNNPNIDFFELPQYIADEYYIHVTEPAITEEGDVLIDYYVEAVDGLGYSKRSPLQHTYIGSGGGTEDSDVVWWSPELPEAGENLTIYYDLNQGTLPGDTDPVYIHIGHSNWQQIITPDPPMVFVPDSGYWQFEYTIPTNASSVDFVFNNGIGQWDNNFDMDWSVPVEGGVQPDTYIMDGQLDDGAVLLSTEDDRELYAAWNGTHLYIAGTPATGLGTDHFLLICHEPESLIGAPWAKNGQVPDWIAFLAQETSNGWSGWFDLSGATFSGLSAGSVLEGFFDLGNEIGETPATIQLALAAYEDPDGGELLAQLPQSLDENDNVDIVELFPFVLDAQDYEPGDVTMDGTIDVLDIVRVVSIILGDINPSDSELDLADLNGDETVDVLDVVMLIDVILGND